MNMFTPARAVRSSLSLDLTAHRSTPCSFPLVLRYSQVSRCLVRIEFGDKLHISIR